MPDFTKKWPEYDPKKTYYSISEKLPVEEDTADAAATAQGRLGRSGRMLESSPFVIHNAIIKSIEAGEIWYGDVDLLSDVDNMIHLSAALGDTVVVLDENNRFVPPHKIMTSAWFVAAHGKTIKSRFTDVD